MMKKVMILAAAVAYAAGMNAAFAADWPEQPTEIQLLIGNAPGGGSDIAARVIAPFIQKHLGPNATIVPINRPGAGGEVAFVEAANATPDGRTIAIGGMPNLASRVVEKDPNPNYTFDQLTYLANYSSSWGSIVVPPDSQFETLPELIEFAKANPGQLKVAVGGIGNDDHLNIMKLARDHDLQVSIVPFGGGAQARAAVMGGHVEVGTMSALEASGFQDSLRILVVLADERREFAPDVPTAKEQGVDLVGGSGKGVIAPAGLPPEVRDALVGAIAAAVEDPEFIEAAKGQGLEIDYLNPEEFENWVRTEYETLKAIYEADPWQ